MGKKAKKGKGGGAAVASNTVIEYPPPRESMTLLYRKASYDILPSKSQSNLLKYHQDKFHRHVCKDYEEFLRSKNFWHVGDELPESKLRIVLKVTN